MPQIHSRRPTARVPWPTILVEGTAKAGKSWAAAELTKSEKVGACYWLDLGEGAADEYGAIPGADYEVIEHDGSYADVLDQVLAVREEAERAARAGEPPVVLIIDQISEVWDQLKNWASDRAKGSAANRRILAQDPNAEVRVSQNLWNDAGSRWNRLVTPLLTFHGVVVLIARGKEVVAMDENGRPIEGQREWRVEVRKNFEFSPTAWVRLQRDQPPLVIGARSVYVGIKPGTDEAKRIVDPAADGRLLEWLIFDALRCDPETAHVRDLKPFHAGELTDDERSAQVAEEQVAERQASQHRRAPGAVRPAGPPPIEQIVAAIERSTTPEEIETILRRLDELKLTETDSGQNELTLAELARAKREALEEGLNNRPKVPTVPPIEAIERAAEAPVAEPPATPAHTPDPTPDPPEQCKANAARTGILRSLRDLGESDEALIAYFGRPLEQVATRRLTQRVKDAIAERKASS